MSCDGDAANGKFLCKAEKNEAFTGICLKKNPSYNSILSEIAIMKKLYLNIFESHITNIV